MENKYYTPQIEEFHVGFEYETNYLSKNWKKQTLKISDADYFFNTYYKDATPLEFRVKHLDREDIESLGWKVKVYDNGSGYFNFKNYNFGLHNSTDEKSSLFMWCTISQNDFGNNIMIFQGTIKNKSELKKLMQMLNIEVDGKS